MSARATTNTPIVAVGRRKYDITDKRGGLVMSEHELRQELSKLGQDVAWIRATLDERQHNDRKDDERTEAKLTQHDKRIGANEKAIAGMKVRVGILWAGALGAGVGGAGIIRALFGG